MRKTLTTESQSEFKKFRCEIGLIRFHIHATEGETQVDKGVVNPGYRGLFQETENPSAGTSFSLIIAFNSSAQENITAKTACT
jgi:hypothetical protein